METAVRCALGRFEEDEIKWYVLFEGAIFWAIILVAWLSYPAEHKYSIMTHTFSFLGSFEDKHNPQWWWIFSTAMFFWGVAMIPLSFYVYRRFAAISGWGACFGTFLFLAGSAGIVFVAMFPDARAKVIGDVSYGDIHKYAAFAIAGGFGLGIIWYGLLLLKNALFEGDAEFNRLQLLLAYLFWGSITGVGVYYQIKWEHLYAAKRAAAKAAGISIGSSWSEALNTIYSFPLWENVAIYTMFLFLMWFTLALPREIPGEA